MPAWVRVSAIDLVQPSVARKSKPSVRRTNLSTIASGKISNQECYRALLIIENLPGHRDMVRHIATRAARAPEPLQRDLGVLAASHGAEKTAGAARRQPAQAHGRQISPSQDMVPRAANALREARTNDLYQFMCHGDAPWRPPSVLMISPNCSPIGASMPLAAMAQIMSQPDLDARAARAKQIAEELFGKALWRDGAEMHVEIPADMARRGRVQLRPGRI